MMMIGKIGKIKLSALILASVMSINFAFADAYKNNVVDVKVNKESTNAVKVTIYTDKPYTEPVVVNKKANNKYVILMPETKSTLKNSPSVSNAYGTISDVSVNTQEGGGGKGYTKITITSQKAITVVPQTQQFVKSKGTQTQTTAKATTQQNTSASNTAKPKTATTTTKNTASSTPAKSVATQKPAVQNAKNASNQTNKASQQTKTAPKSQVKQTKPAQNTVAIKPSNTSANLTKPVSSANNATNPIQQKKQPIEILEQEVKNNTSAANVVTDKTDKVLNDEIKENLSKQQAEDLKKGKKKKKNSSVYEANSDGKTTVDNFKTVKKSYSDVSFWKIILLLAAILFPILVIMAILGMDKNINKKIDESFRNNEDNLYPDETPSENMISEEIPPIVPIVENESSNDDIESVAVSEPVSESSQEATFNSFDEMLDNVETEPQSYHEEYLQQNNPDVAVYSENTNESFENDFDDSDFDHETEENKEIVSAVTDELNTVEETEYDDDIDLADFSSVNDSDFFDELAIQTMAANNTEGLPDQLPADEIFDFMTEPENVSDENAIVSDAPNQETIKYNDDLTMLTEVKLNDDSGLYLVNYENFSSLVGHIKEDYFVIKKFDDIVSDKIYLKETEKLKDSTRYLVRVGKNKMVVEVSDTSMSRLLDL